MATTNSKPRGLKEDIKEAFVQALEEQRDLLHDVFAEVLEDFALANAIREGQKTKQATRDEIFAALQGKL